MDKYTAIVAMTALISGAVMVGAIVQAIIKGIESKRSRALPDSSTARLEERLSRIEQAVDSIAVEVERVSEGQRFTTRLLADKQTERG